MNRAIKHIKEETSPARHSIRSGSRTVSRSFTSFRYWFKSRRRISATRPPSIAFCSYHLQKTGSIHHQTDSACLIPPTGKRSTEINKQSDERPIHQRKNQLLDQER